MKQGKYIISGYVAGQKFRPSNWSERLCEAGATFDPLKRVMRYSEHLYPRQCNQYGCSVFVDFSHLAADLADYINWFVRSNNLEVVSLEKIINLQPLSGSVSVEHSGKALCNQEAA